MFGPIKIDQQKLFCTKFVWDQKNSLDTNKKANSIDPPQKFEVLLEFDTDDPNLISFIITIIRY